MKIIIAIFSCDLSRHKIFEEYHNCIFKQKLMRSCSVRSQPGLTYLSLPNFFNPWINPKTKSIRVDFEHQDLGPVYHTNLMNLINISLLVQSQEWLSCNNSLEGQHAFICNNLTQ